MRCNSAALTMFQRIFLILQDFALFQLNKQFTFHFACFNLVFSQ